MVWPNGSVRYGFVRAATLWGHAVTETQVTGIEDIHEDLMVSVLDTFTFRAGDRALALPSGSRKLLAFLALRDRPATRHLVASTLWPEAPPQDAASSLRSALWRLKPTASAAVVVEDLDLGPHPDVRVDIRDSRALAHRLLDPSREILPGTRPLRRSRRSRLTSCPVGTTTGSSSRTRSGTNCACTRSRRWRRISRSVSVGPKP